jgi:hypothetical protein
VGLADATELEAMALPSSDTGSIAIKEEALLANFHQRFKKDQIYVSLFIEPFCKCLFVSILYDKLYVVHKVEH